MANIAVFFIKRAGKEIIEMITMEDIDQSISEFMGEILNNNFKVYLKGQDLKLSLYDERGIPEIFYYNDHLLIVNNWFLKNLDYYADSDCRRTIGDFTIFSCESKRVSEWLERLNNV
jgi:hypothetical protein